MKHINQYIALIFVVVMSAQYCFAKKDSIDNEYVIDTTHSSISFGVKHLSVADTIGVFEEFDGRLVFTNGHIKKLKGQVAIKSINTFNAARDSDLQNPKFFTQDTAFLESLSFNQDKLKAKLTINNITKEILFDTLITGPIRNPSLEQKTNQPITLHNPSFRNKNSKINTDTQAIDNQSNPLTNPFMQTPSNSDCGCYMSYGDNVLGIELFTKINRFDFNIATDTPKELLGDTVWIKVILEASK